MTSALGMSASMPAHQLHDATFKDVAEEYIVQHQNKTEALVMQRQKHYHRLQHFARGALA